jgi:hypothetical protein
MIRNLSTMWKSVVSLVPCHFIYLWLYSTSLGLGRFFSHLIFFIQSVGLLGRGISPSQGRFLHTGQRKQNKRTHTSIPQVGIEPTISVLERAKTVHVLDRAATVIGRPCHFTTSKASSSTHCIGDWVGPRAGLDVMEKRNVLPAAGIARRLSSP